jgi:type IV secretory pathway VirB3-like protein
MGNVIGHKKTRSLFAKLHKLLFLVSITLFHCASFADEDPISKTGNKIYLILFGSLGVSVCAIIMGATFILAKVGKVSWDQFLYIGFCTAGFLGTPSIISIIKSAVG